MSGSRRAKAAFACAAIACGSAFAGAETFTFSADSMSGNSAKGRERTVLVGKARVVSDTMVITADRIELYGKDYRFADCRGNIVVIDETKGMRLMTENLSYDRVEKLSRLQGPSVMEDKKNSVVIKGNYMENDDKRETALIQIDVRILKENLSCRSQFARYDRKGKILDLSGSPVVRKKGDEYRADRIRVEIETENVIMEGGVTGSIRQAEKTAPSGDAKEAGEEDKNPVAPPVLPVTIPDTLSKPVEEPVPAPDTTVPTSGASR